MTRGRGGEGVQFQPQFQFEIGKKGREGRVPVPRPVRDREERVGGTREGGRGEFQFHFQFEIGEERVGGERRQFQFQIQFQFEIG